MIEGMGDDIEMRNFQRGEFYVFWNRMFKKRDCDRLSLPNFSQDITVTACLQVTVDLPKILICAI